LIPEFSCATPLRDGFRSCRLHGILVSLDDNPALFGMLIRHHAARRQVRRFLANSSWASSPDYRRVAECIIEAGDVPRGIIRWDNFGASHPRHREPILTAPAEEISMSELLTLGAISPPVSTCAPAPN